jgi:hypothetical protein
MQTPMPPTRFQLLALVLLLNLMPLPALARTSGPSTPPPPGRLAPEPSSEGFLDIGDPVRDWLALVPDTEATRRWLVFGDVEAWFDESAIERPPSVEALMELDEEVRRPVLFQLPRQTMPPAALNLDGYDLTNTLQMMEAGTPPEQLTVLRVANHAAAVGSALEASGYTPSMLDGVTLYSRRGDNEIDIAAETPSARLATLNRIAVIDRGVEGEVDLLIGRSTPVIEGALAGFAGEGDSLANDMGYRTLANAVDFEGLVPGTPVGIMVLGGEQLIPPPISEEEGIELEARLAAYADEPLPPYRMAAFGTSRDGEETYLTLYLVLAPGEAAEATATILSDRLQEYESMVADFALLDRVEIIERGAFVNELEVAYVTMRVLPDAALDWYRMIMMRDLLFLAPGD